MANKLPPWLTNPWVLGGAAVAGLLVLLRSATSGNGGPPPDDSGPVAGKVDRVLLVGDSLAVGINGPMKQLAAASGIEYQGKGVTGSRIDQWAKTLLDEQLGFEPTIVLVSLGTNDMKMSDPVVQQSGHVQTILQKARDKGAQVVWIVPPTMPFPDKGVRQMILDAQPDGVVRADYLELPRAADQIHMTPSGYSTFAEAVWTCLTAEACPAPPANFAQRINPR